MSYETYWKLDAQTTRQVFRNIVKDFRTILPHLEIRKGLLEHENGSSFIRDHIILNDETIMFNIECKGEAFNYSRTGYSSQSSSCKTNQLPYDIAVNCALLIAKKHLRHEIHIFTDGETKDWRKALLLCQYVLGDEYFYMHVTEKNSMIRYRWWDMKQELSEAEKTLETYNKIGFSIEDTGGGCRVLQRYVKNGYVWITSHADGDVPDMLNESVTLGLYDEGGNMVTVETFGNTQDLLNSTLYQFIAKTNERVNS